MFDFTQKEMKEPNNKFMCASNPLLEEGDA